MIRKIIRYTVTIILGIICVIPLIIEQAWAQSDADEVTILFTHDLHDNLYSFPVERDGETVLLGGYARLATAIAEARKQHDNSLLVDAGDFSMGSLFQTIFSSESPSLRLMGQLGYDATTLGNHEFDFRADGLAASLQAAKESGGPVPDLLVSNLEFPTDEAGEIPEELRALQEAMDSYGVKSYKIVEKGKVKIGLFGLMGEDADSNAPMSGVNFSPIVDAAKVVVNQLQEEGVDLIVALSHSGTSDQKKKSEDEVLAKKVPEIDVIISGHTHTFLEEPLLVGNTVIGSTGEYGQNLGKMTLKQSEAGAWELVDYELLPIHQGLEEDTAIRKEIEGFKEKVETSYLDHFDMSFDQVLGYSDFNITDFSSMYDRHAEDPLGNLIGDAYIATVEAHDPPGADPITAAIVPVGTIRNTLYEGEITVSDVFNVSSLGIGRDKLSGYPLVEVYVTGKELKTIAEVDASVAPIMPASQLYVAGLSYSFNPNRLLFNKVTDVAIVDREGKRIPIDDDRLYRIVAGLYSGQMLPVVSEKSYGLLSVLPKDRDGEPIRDFEDHILYMNDGSEREIKEWYAIASYISSFATEEGEARIPARYADLEGRKVQEDHKQILALIKQPNGIALAIYGTGLGIVAILASLVAYFIRRRRKKDKESLQDRVS